ncbi:zinc ABC transporter substrate-binding protein [Aerococcus loyolae]|nr:zinc ABC transporter substrate-binding protein [Aerococcus loyolae]
MCAILNRKSYDLQGGFIMKTMIKKIGFCLSLLALLVSFGCNQGKEAADKNGKGKLTVMTSFYPMQLLTQAVVGDQADVQVMISGKQEAHHFEPSAKDMARLQEADVFVYNSDDMEAWVESSLNSIDTDRVKVVESADNIEPISGAVETIEGEVLTAEDDHDHDHDHEGDHNHEEGGLHVHEYDPHTWLSPKNAMIQTQAICDAMKEVDPDQAELYQKNTDAFLEKLEALDHDYQRAFSNHPDQSFVTAHAAFGYLADEYYLKQIALTGVSDDAEPSPQAMAGVIDYIKQNNLPVIYFQENTSSKLADTLAAETGVKVSSLNALESASSDQPISGDTYINLMRENLEHLKLTIN